MNLSKIATLLFAAALISACGKLEEPRSITPTRPAFDIVEMNADGTLSDPTTATGPSYQKDIYPLFKAKCATCHGGSGSLTNYLVYENAVAKKAQLMDRVVVKKNMPMGGSMTAAERTLVNQWIAQGTILN
ncbi:MAG: hypothetical protein ACXWQO_09950 [Bdellovibrionota bacterium]